MAVAVFLRYPGVTAAQYDRLVAGLELDASPPIGAILHVAAVTANGVNVCEVWQTEAAAEAFLERRLRAALDEARIRCEVEYRIVPLHNMFAPDIETIERIGSVSLPATVPGR